MPRSLELPARTYSIANPPRKKQTDAESTSARRSTTAPPPSAASRRRCAARDAAPRPDQREADQAGDGRGPTATRWAPKMPSPKNSRPRTSAISATAMTRTPPRDRRLQIAHCPARPPSASLPSRGAVPARSLLAAASARPSLPFLIAAHSSAAPPPMSLAVCSWFGSTLRPTRRAAPAGAVDEAAPGLELAVFGCSVSTSRRMRSARAAP